MLMSNYNFRKVFRSSRLQELFLPRYYERDVRHAKNAWRNGTGSGFGQANGFFFITKKHRNFGNYFETLWDWTDYHIYVIRSRKLDDKFHGQTRKLISIGRFSNWSLNVRAKITSYARIFGDALSRLPKITVPQLLTRKHHSIHY